MTKDKINAKMIENQQNNLNIKKGEIMTQLFVFNDKLTC